MKPIIMTLLLACAFTMAGQELVILHTNDTHSQILPDRHDMGGMARRKVLIDSVKAARDNVMVIDAGDAVQGSLFYTLFNGEVERKLMNELGYDIQILGNHEFDKGMDALAREWKQLGALKLSSNYDFAGSALDSVFHKSLIRVVDGKKVGFLAINLNPSGMIVAENSKGVNYIDPVFAANQEASRLKRLGADYVIAITHIGLENDTDCDDERLATGTHDIDLIIGGHSHTRLDKPVKVKNPEGKEVMIVQTGSNGSYLGELDIDLAKGVASSRLIPVTSRLDDRVDKKIVSLIDSYSTRVDSLKKSVIGTSSREYKKGSDAQLKMMADFVKAEGEALLGEKVDMAVMNRGGLRASLPKGDVTQGDVIDMAPFDNKIVVVELKKNDFLRLMDAMEGSKSFGISRTFNLKGKKHYRVATIDYLAAGNDYLVPFRAGKVIAESPDILYQSLIKAVKNGTVKL